MDDVVCYDPPAEINLEEENTKSNFAAAHTSSFRDFLLHPDLLQAVALHGFECPSEVQQSCIPQAIMGTNILCQAKAGMGKTAVFVLSTLQRLTDSSEADSGSVQIVALAHTRELADQIFKEYQRFSHFLTIARPIVIYGGVAAEDQVRLITTERPNIVVGTPGRILALLKEKKLNFGSVKMFVLDECDHMLDRIEMRREVQDIFVRTPKDKQVLMFTATLNEKSRELCKKFMQGTLLEISVDDDQLSLVGLVQYYALLEEKQKNQKLLDILDSVLFNNCVIFVRRPDRAQALSDILSKERFPSTYINSHLDMPQRLSRFEEFKKGKFRVLVSTNLMGRGVDINRVNLVVNYDMPENEDTYMHRVGRAGRFNTRGLAISFVSSGADKDVLEQVQKRYVVNIPPMPAQIDSSTYMNS